MLGRVHAFVEGREMAHAQHLVLGKGLQIQVQFGRKGEGAFRADQKMRQVGVGLLAVQRRLGPGALGRAAGHQGIDVVAADPAHQVGEGLADVVALAPADIQKLGDHVLLRGVQLGRGLVVRHFAEAHGAAVHGYGVDGAHVVAHGAVDDGARAAGVVARHAAQGGARRGRDVDGKPQAVGLEIGVQVIEHQTRFDQGLAPRGIEVENLVQMFRQIDDQGFADRLAALRGAAAARQNRHAGVAGDGDDRFHVLGVLGHDDAQGFDLIDRGVRRIAPARERIEQDLALDRGLQAAGKGGVALGGAAARGGGGKGCVGRGHGRGSLCHQRGVCRVYQIAFKIQ